MNTSKLVSVIAIFASLASAASAAHMHTHVGLNQDGTWGTSDDSTLWIFATPGQPQWPAIEMAPTGEYIGGMQIYVAGLDCWHSAHPASGLYQLDFNTDSTKPDWRIALKRTSFSDPANFWMEDEATTLEILKNDGDTFAMHAPAWSTSLADGKGGYGAWRFETHTGFLALADGPGQTFSATFTVMDLGNTAYAESLPYTIDFVTVPEPASVMLLAIGASAVRGRRRMRNPA